MSIRCPIFNRLNKSVSDSNGGYSRFPFFVLPICPSPTFILLFIQLDGIVFSSRWKSIDVVCINITCKTVVPFDIRPTVCHFTRASHRSACVACALHTARATTLSQCIYKSIFDPEICQIILENSREALDGDHHTCLSTSNL